MDTQVPFLPPSSDSNCAVGRCDERRTEDDSEALDYEPARSATRWESWLARRVYRRLKLLREGVLELDDDAGLHRFGVPVDDLPTCRVQVRNARVYRDLAGKGSMGVDQSYLRGDWDTKDLVALFRLFLRNADAMADLEGGISWWIRPLNEVRRWLTRNTVSGSRRNIPP